MPAAPPAQVPRYARDDTRLHYAAMSFDRRTFLRLAAIAPFAPAAFATQPHLLQMNGYPLNAETPLELLTDYLTPNDLFFVRSHWIPRMPDAKTWRLVVDGDVRTQLSLTLDDLKKMPRAEATCVLQC